MEELSTAQKIQQMRGLALKVRDLSGMPKGTQSSREHIIKYAISQNYNVSGHQLDEMTQALLHRNDFKIQIGDKQVTAREVADDAAKIIKTGITFKPKSEWIKEAKHIVLEMTDGSITAHDLAHRANFFQNIDARQAELLSALFLYENSSLPAAKAMVAEIKHTLSLLEKTKTVVQKSTKEPEEALLSQEITPEEQTKSKIYIQALDYMDQEKEIPDAMKVKLEISEGIGFGYSVGEKFLSGRNQTNSKGEIIDRINQLRGRQQQLNVAKSDLRQLRFDKEAYALLQQRQR